MTDCQTVPYEGCKCIQTGPTHAGPHRCPHGAQWTVTPLTGRILTIGSTEDPPASAYHARPRRLEGEELSRPQVSVRPARTHVPDRWPFGVEAAARLVAATSNPNERAENRDEWSPRLILEPELAEAEFERAEARLRSAIRELRARHAVLAAPEQSGRRTTCGAGMDGECYADGCVQILDGEPDATGRFCPLPSGDPLVALRESEEADRD